jgi:hypothetical protein
MCFSENLEKIYKSKYKTIYINEYVLRETIYLVGLLQMWVRFRFHVHLLYKVYIEENLRKA